MKQAIEEGFILDVLQNYITYKTYYQLNKEIEEDPRCKTNNAKRQIARFVELHETNIAQRIEVIVEHFRTTVMDELGGTAKAMVITASREGAVKYHKAFEDYIAKKGYDNIHALVAFSGKVTMKEDDGQKKEYTEVGINGFAYDKLRFTRPKSCNVVGFGVAVNAKIDILACLPCFAISSVIMSSAVFSSIVISPEPSVIVTAAISFPAVDECASSIMTANFLFLRFTTSSTI